MRLGCLGERLGFCGSGARMLLVRGSAVLGKGLGSCEEGAWLLWEGARLL